MASNLQRGNEYKRAKADLGLSARAALRAIELLIQADPDHRENRVDVLVGGVPTVIEQNGGLLVFFRRLDSETVVLILVVDLTDPPDWFVQPIGTWAEELLT